MKSILIKLTAAFLVCAPATAYAGEFYPLRPSWLEFFYHFCLLAIIITSVYTCYSIYATMRGGKLGTPWLMMLIALSVALLRTILGFLTVVELAFFKAIAFAILDLAFFLLLIIGLFLYKENLD
jgi:hypothetical protein